MSSSATTSSPASSSSLGGASDQSGAPYSKAEAKELNTAFFLAIVEQCDSDPNVDMTHILKQYEAFAVRLENGEGGEDEASAFQFTPCPPGLSGILKEVVDELVKERPAPWTKGAPSMAFGAESPADGGDVMMKDASVSGKTDTGAATSPPVSTADSPESIKMAQPKAAKRRREDVDLEEGKVEAVIDAVKKHKLGSPQE